MRDILRDSATPERKRRIAAKLLELAEGGDLRAIALLLDNHDGRLPTQIGGVDDGDGERPIPLRILPPARPHQ